MRRRMMRRVFKGLGTTIELRVWPGAGRHQLAASGLTHAVSFLRRAEARLSRFDPNSELSRLNHGTRTPRHVSRLTFAVIRAALTAAEATDGLFDPAILQALLAAGYDRSFDELRGREMRATEGGSGSAGISPAHDTGSEACETPAFPGRHSRAYVRTAADNPDPAFVGQWREIELDAVARTVWLPPGVGLDLGGIAKGWLADRVLRGLSQTGAAYADLGGDIAFSAPPAGTDDWRIEIEDPRAADGVAAIMRVTGGGVATSGVTRRAWNVGGEVRHHLIDPRNGRPAVTDLLSVTVAAPTAAAAEVAAKATLLLGGEAGRRALLFNGQLAGVLIPARGEPIMVGDCGGRGLAPERKTRI